MDQPLRTTAVVPSPPPIPSGWSSPPVPPGWPSPPVTAGLEVGPVIHRSVRLWLRNLHRLGLLAVVVQLPVIVWFAGVFAQLPGPNATPDDARSLAAWGLGLPLVYALTLAASVWLAGAVSVATVSELRGERLGFGGVVAAGLRPFFRMLGAVLLVTLAVLPAICTIVGPFFLLVMWAFTAQAVAVERLGPIAALRRSAELTRGSRWRVLGVVAVLSAVLFGVMMLFEMIFIVGGIASVAASGGFGGPPAGGAALPPVFIGVMVAMQVIQALGSVLIPIGVSVAYHDLRQAREGGTPAQLAHVFE